MYWSSLNNLKLSYKVSDLESLNVSATREVYNHKGTVEYKVSHMISIDHSEKDGGMYILPECIV